MEKSFGEIVEDDINISQTSDDSGSTGEIEEVDNLVDLIKKKQAEVHPSLSSKFLIWRVPHIIRDIKPKAYQPRVVSIGPFHRGNARYKSMEAYKMRYLNKVIQRNTKVPLKKYVEFLKAQETNVRQSYSEIIEMGRDEFLTMLLVDSCFIIEFILSSFYEEFRDEDFSILGSSRLSKDLYFDLMLLENQIPFFVLEGLYNLAMTGFTTIPLIRLAIDFFSYHDQQNKSHGHINSIKHFTDLILMFYRPMAPRKAAAKQYVKTQTVTELDEAGIKLRKSPSKCLLDITFRDGILEIPCIVIEGDTESVIRNMMALELCNYFDDSYMTDYIYFLDYLINTSKDVDILVKSGIMDNWLGDTKRVADIVNNLNKHTLINADNFQFSSLSKELNAYCKVPKNKWRAALKRDYFSSPWRSASTSAAIFLLVLTLIQTILSIMSAAI